MDTSKSYNAAGLYRYILQISAIVTSPVLASYRPWNHCVCLLLTRFDRSLVYKMTCRLLGPKLSSKTMIPHQSYPNEQTQESKLTNFHSQNCTRLYRLQFCCHFVRGGRVKYCIFNFHDTSIYLFSNPRWSYFYGSLVRELHFPSAFWSLY